MREEGYRPSEAEIHKINAEAMPAEFRDGSAAGPEKAPALDAQSSREEILRGLTVPEMPSGKSLESKPAKKGGLPSQLEVAMQKTDQASTQEEVMEQQQKQKQ